MNEGLRNTDQLLKELKQGDTGLLDEVYLENRDAFLNWIAKNFNLKEEDAADIYQDTLIVFYENVRKGKLKQLSVNLQTYLFSVGKNLALKRHRSMRLIRKHEDELVAKAESVEDPFSTESDERIEAVKAAFEKMEEPCHSILKRYYYFRQSMTEIAAALNYKNADTVKSQKSRCMKHLKKMVKTVFNG
ncbi:MAG TPA: sigma-70 family RNA polymerase sigma factor [Cryomorphaceae bacterium]|nr:sigma-70 family RNA polymerase sigma factor [Cryomorphaceae bacterium]